MKEEYLNIFNICLQDVLDGKGNLLSPEYISEKHKIDLSKAKSLQSEFIKIGLENSLFEKSIAFEKPYLLPYNPNIFKCEKFIGNGSISGYLKREDGKSKLHNITPTNWGKISVIVAIVLAIIFFFLDMFKPELKHNILYQLSDRQPPKTEQVLSTINEDSLSERNDSLKLNIDSLNTLPLDSTKIDTINNTPITGKEKSQ